MHDGLPSEPTPGAAARGSRPQAFCEGQNRPGGACAASAVGAPPPRRGAALIRRPGGHRVLWTTLLVVAALTPSVAVLTALTADPALGVIAVGALVTPLAEGAGLPSAADVEVCSGPASGLRGYVGFSRRHTEGSRPRRA
ncbi:hypothetical protein CQJ94_19505 [Glycomyces fuscus]|nr:hypothetical protein CQJ94_19505 [Glycomyces fuscus]